MANKRLIQMNTVNAINIFIDDIPQPSILEKFLKFCSQKKTPKTVSHKRQITCLHTVMPQHHDSVMAVAYDPLSRIDLNADILDCLKALSDKDFNIANAAYLRLRDYKNSGYIMEYAIAGSSSEALEKLNKYL